MRLTGVSFAHPRVGSARRAALSVPPGGIDAGRLRVNGAGHDVFFLATCLRVEIAWAGESDSVADVFGALYGPDFGFEDGAVQSDLDAFRHLSRVAAGLDSPLVGEPEVLGQFRRAVAELDDTGGTGSLVRGLEAAVGVARSARRLLGEVPRGSLAAAAASRSSGHGRVAVLGGGAMARATISHLNGADITVFARRPTPVAGHPPEGWDRVPEALATFPAVVSTVPGRTPVLAAGELVAIVSRRESPLTLVDLGMPPGFDASEVSGVAYSGIDELAAAVAVPRAKVAETDVDQTAAAAWRRMTSADRAGSVIAAVIGRADASVAEEVSRFAPRLATADDPERVLRQVAHTVARRVLHPAISYLGTTDEPSVEVLAEAFGVER